MKQAEDIPQIKAARQRQPELPLIAGMWVIWGRPGEERGINLACPMCGNEGDLDGYVVDYYGYVEPSLECINCGFNMFLILEGWVPGEHKT